MSEEVKKAMLKVVDNAASPDELEKAVEAFQRVLLTTGKRKYCAPSPDELKQRYKTNLQLRDIAFHSQIPFIDRSNDKIMKLYQGFILIGGVSGQGKSTTSANIVAGYLKSQQKKKALVVTNEENSADVYDRIACVMLGVSFKGYRANRLDEDTLEHVKAYSRNLIDRVVVEDGADKYDMTCLEDVQASLVHASEGQYGIALLDYLQTVNSSAEEPQLEPVQVSKKLGFFLKDYGRKVEIPVVVFAQLKPQSESPDFKTRIQNDRTIYDHAVVVIEVVPDFETGITRFVIHKDRFLDGQGKEIEMEFQGGRFVAVGSGHL